MTTRDKILSELPSRIASKVGPITETGCWSWNASFDGNGYAQVRVGQSMAKAYRFIYESARGPVPTGLELDHLCRNRWCVNPDHLEAVTHAENMRRSIGYRVPKTHCPRGHSLTPENTRFVSGYPTCRECANEASRQYRARNAAPRICRGCGCEWTIITAGCLTCANRLRQRHCRERAVAAA